MGCGASGSAKPTEDYGAPPTKPGKGGAAEGRYNELRPSPPNAKYKLCVVEFNVPGAKNGGSDKGPNGHRTSHRIDSIPIANSVIAAGGACQIIKSLSSLL